MRGEGRRYEGGGVRVCEGRGGGEGLRVCEGRGERGGCVRFIKIDVLCVGMIIPSIQQTEANNFVTKMAKAKPCVYITLTTIL